MTVPHRPHADRAHLARAIALAERARATTSPNPAVGCVLVRDERVVGEAATAPVGRAHAEAAALDAAGDRASGATAYVTLEPCAHHGRTAPCTDALRRAGVARVVYALADPNPVAAGGAAVLRAAGIPTTGPDDLGPLLTGTVRAQLEGFLHLVAHGRPHVTLKLAQSADGALVAPPGRRWITGPVARAAVHRWRAASDAVLVGSGTVLADDPRLDVRPGVRSELRSGLRSQPSPDDPTGVPTAGADHQPRPVVLDARLRTPPDAAVARPGAVVVTVPTAPSGPRAALEHAGVEVVAVAPTAGGVDLGAALRALAARGIATVLAEPGGTLARALVAAGLVDRLVLHVAAPLGDGPPVRVVPTPPGRVWRTERAGGAGPDLVLHLVPAEAGDVTEEAA